MTPYTTGDTQGKSARLVMKGPHEVCCCSNKAEAKMIIAALNRPTIQRLSLVGGDWMDVGDRSVLNWLIEKCPGFWRLKP